ncbi:hypothetical protein C2S51_013503 [Perilla frutescens var. frutescens]|nr:hypothetical protein C2S51_013503 [Perilla frutescens var. frutescens]
MSSLSIVEAKLPPGFRFHPRDEELICDYLIKWIAGSPHPHLPLLIQVDLNNCEPWDIPEFACVGGKEWYFYSQRDRKYATGLRTNRATVSGYWKATGKDRPVIRKGILVGMRKTLVFYQGRAPKGRKTDWVMHEFRVEGPGPKSTPSPSPRLKVEEDWVLCRVFFKSRSSELMEIGAAAAEKNVVVSPTSLLTFHDEQVPCFSNIFNTNQFSFSQTAAAAAADNKMIVKDDHLLINQLAKMETNAYNETTTTTTLIEGASPSFGEEGSSDDSYLSQLLWINNYDRSLQQY